MPSVWSKKDERMYAAIKKSCLQSDSRRTKTCPRIAASTVNKRRREEGRTLDEFRWFTGNPVIDVLSVAGLAVVGISIVTSYQKSKRLEKEAAALKTRAEEIERAAIEKLARSRS